MVTWKFTVFFNSCRILFNKVTAKGFTATAKAVFDIIRGGGVFSFFNRISLSLEQEGLRPVKRKTATDNYFTELEESRKISKYYKELRSHAPRIFKNKLVSFYLPQFHPFKENNENWGEGFTEWTNVTRTFPFFNGHQQPRLPQDLGFYDLRLVENIQKQAKMARNYGIHGFCFHYYWFSGYKVMETPLQLLAKNKDIDINFCLCWANENWTRRWDGNEKDVLLAQLDRNEDYLLFIKDVAIYFNDPRYIKVKGAPVLVIYRPELLKDVKRAASVWREYAKTLGFPDLHLIASESFQDNPPSETGFDASVDFAPNRFPMQEISYKHVFYHPKFRGRVFEYSSAMDFSIKKKKDHPFYHSLCLAWDNCARKKQNGAVVHNAHPPIFRKWLDALLKKKPLNDMIFINAWNEWAEGTYLEPDQRLGFAYLQECREALEAAEDSNT